MNIEIASNSLEIVGRQGRILKLDFEAPLDDLSIRRHRKALRAVHRSNTRQERDLQFILLELDQVLTPYFVADDHTHPVRVLNGLTLTAIVARKAPVQLGGLGLDVYGRVLRDLQGTGAFRQPIAGYPGLEALFADKVASAIEMVARDRHQRGTLEKVDEVFYALSTGRKLESRKQFSAVSLSVVSAAKTGSGSSQAAQIQSGHAFEGVSRLTELECKVKQISASGFASAERGTAGSYVDFNGRVRSVPRLSAVTIQGIASAPGVLTAGDEILVDYQQVAADASAFRRSLHLGGRKINPESAEFHVRIFRAIGLTATDVATLSADSLKALVQKAIDTNALAFEPEARAA